MKISLLNFPPILVALTIAAVAATDTDPMKDALAFREALATALLQGKESPPAAIAQLKARTDASGLGIAPEADFAYAAIDIGQRLLAGGKDAEAEKFFAAAEEALGSLIKRTPDTNAREKAEYLSRVALVRWKYLGKPGQARRDLDQAILLPGSDSYLKQSRENLLRSHAEAGKNGQQEVTP